MKRIITTLIILMNLFGYSQDIIVDSTLIVKKTHIETSGYIFETVTEQIFENNTLKLVFTNPRFGGKFLIINISDNIFPEIYLTSDYPAFDENYSKSIELEFYKITINQNKFNHGDIFMAKIECVSKPFKPYIGNPIFEYFGEIKCEIKKE